MKVPLQFTGGHETDPQDGGRPVVLIAAALQVTPETFREAFRGVTPARGRGPTREEAQKNKIALMHVLQPHGITNERLDEVSDYYRYRPQRGELWTNTPAKGYAVVEKWKIKEILVTNPGSGYSSPPQVSVRGMEQTVLKATLKFGNDLKQNGSIDSVTIVSRNSSNAEQRYESLSFAGVRHQEITQPRDDPLAGVLEDVMPRVVEPE